MAIKMDNADAAPSDMPSSDRPPPDQSTSVDVPYVEFVVPPPVQHSVEEQVFDLLAHENAIMAALPASRGQPATRRQYFSNSSLDHVDSWDANGHSTMLGQTPDEPEYEEIDKAVRRSPPYLVSVIIHVGALIALGLWMLYEPKEDNITILVTYSDVEPDSLEIEPFELGTNEDLDNPEIDPPSELLAIERQELFAPYELLPEIDLLHTMDNEKTSVLPDTPNPNRAPPTIGRLLKGRKPELRAQLLRRYGGNRQTEDAVKNALDWLVRNQREDGSWSLTGPYADGVTPDSDLAATGLALLALQGAGHTHQEKTKSPYSAAVAKGWKWLLSMQDASARSGAVSHSQGYAHAICTIAVCELYAMSRDEKFRRPAQQAVNFCLEAQGSNGGWRYHKGEDGDMSVTGWYVMALQSAKMGGLKVPDENLVHASTFLDLVQTDDGQRYGYMEGSTPTPTLTAEGLLCRQYLGWKHDDERLVAGVKFLEQYQINWKARDAYYWYYATQVLHHMEGEPWKRWNDVMSTVLPSMQIKAGPESGSWDPADDRWEHQGGRLYVTCLHTFMLEVYYRHLPIYSYNLDN